MSRARILILLTACALLAGALAACGGGGGEEDPQTVIDNATFEGIKSANLDLSLGLKSTGAEGGDVNVSLGGPFQGRGGKNLPEVSMMARAKGTAGGEPIDFEGGLTLLSDRAYVNYKGTEYEVDPTTFGFVKSGLEQAEQREQGQGGDVTACQKAATGLQVGEFVEDLKGEGSAKVEGTETTKVSGKLDVKGAVDAIVKLTEDPACSAELKSAGSLPLDRLKADESKLTESVKEARAEVYVGEDDIVRRLVAELTVEPKGGGEKFEVDFDLSLGGVNEEQEIVAPSGAKPLQLLFQKLDVNPIELLQLINGENEAGVGGLLEGILGGGESSSGASEQRSYGECLEGAKTAADLQKCANLRH